MPNDAPGKLRNIQDDPFAVRGNRETVAGELLLSYDPTPATWMYEWDNDFAEDAKFAMNLGFVFAISQLPKMLQLDFSDRTYSRFPTQHPHKICGK
jgi:hypothetical protein